MIGPSIGMRNAYRIVGVIRHEQSGLLVAPAEGIIYGRAGTPVGTVCSDGYVRLGGRRGMPCLYAHRLIWATVNGDIPDGLEIDHLNGNKSDNRACNLEAVTRSENVLRAIAMGLVPIGEQKPAARLTEALVRAIRKTTGEKSTTEWARELGVDKRTVLNARDGTTWRHVPLRTRSTRSAPKASARRRRPTGPLRVPVEAMDGADAQISSYGDDLASVNPKTKGGSSDE